MELEAEEAIGSSGHRCAARPLVSPHLFSSAGPTLPLLPAKEASASKRRIVATPSTTAPSSPASSALWTVPGSPTSPATPASSAWEVRKAISPGALDWPCEVWRAVQEAQRLHLAAEARLAAIRKEQAVKHVRANRVEDAEDDARDAERCIVGLQRMLGVADAEIAEEATRAALAAASKAAAAWLSAVTAGLGLPSEVQWRVASCLLPSPVTTSTVSAHPDQFGM
eukprot:TRINITY_DN24805_c0_g1_i1.p1 TRINITY_DN24805_c0_g1~~TRINITY_DN24805_c0_g1_i1.p1  ORF type:complete len:244 (-),score=41.08 TRINITY_DN24805_c0_g1_i1:4-678(-)